jgi:drug/metabolite transporter (DMT)-like permease
MTATYDRLPRQGLLLLAALTLFWGVNWTVMKVILTEIPPLTFRWSCLLGGGGGLLLVAAARGEKIRVPAGAWPRLLTLSLFNVIGWNILAVYGVLLLPSGRAALLGYTMPLWGSLLSVWVLGERLTPQRVTALVLGLAGIGVLMGGSLEGMMQAPLGAACMIAAAWSWALGIVLLKRWQLAMPTMVLTGWTMFLAGIPILVVALPLEGSRLVWPSLGPALSLFYNIFVAFMFCYWAWNRIVLMVPVAVSSLSSLTTPLIGVLSGVLFLGEALGWREIAAAALILAAVGAVTVKR